MDLSTFLFPFPACLSFHVAAVPGSKAYPEGSLTQLGVVLHLRSFLGWQVQDRVWHQVRLSSSSGAAPMILLCGSSLAWVRKMGSSPREPSPCLVLVFQNATCLPLILPRDQKTKLFPPSQQTTHSDTTATIRWADCPGMQPVRHKVPSTVASDKTECSLSTFPVEKNRVGK